MRTRTRTTRTRILAVAMTAALVTTVLSAASSPTAGAAGHDWTAVDQALEDGTGGWFEAEGGSLVIWHNGVEVHEVSFGDTTVSGYDPDTPIPVYSVSKWVAGTVIMSLVSDGIIDLDDRPSTQPAFAGITVNDSRFDDITVEMLLSHTSGIRSLLVAEACIGDVPQHESGGKTFEECVQDIADRTLAYAPGTRFNYSQRNHHILAYYAQMVTGQAWARLVQDRLFDPCGMDSIHYLGIDENDRDDAANNPWVSGGLQSDISDLAVFADMQLDGSCGSVQVLTPASLTAMRSDNVCGQVSIGFDPFLLTNYGYGLSTMLDECNGGNEPNLVSHPGAGGTIPWVDTGRNYSAVLYLESSLNKGVRLWDDVRPLIASAIDA